LSGATRAAIAPAPPRGAGAGKRAVNRHTHEVHPARLDRGPPADPHRLPTLLRRPAVPPPGLHTGARDDRARLCPRPGVGLPGPAFPPAGPSQLAAGPRLRSAAATARPVRAQAEPRTQGTGSKRTHLRLRVCLPTGQRGYAVDAGSML